MIEIFNTTMEHARMIKLRDFDKDTFGGNQGLMSLIRNKFDKVHSKTMMYEGKVLCILGFEYFNPGLANIFLIASEDVCVSPIVFARAVKTYVKKAIAERPSIYRVQTQTVTNPMYDRWMRFLGFQEEGTLRRYDQNGLDYKMWGLLPNG